MYEHGYGDGGCDSALLEIEGTDTDKVVKKANGLGSVRNRHVPVPADSGRFRFRFLVETCYVVPIPILETVTWFRFRFQNQLEE